MSTNDSSTYFIKSPNLSVTDTSQVSTESLFSNHLLKPTHQNAIFKIGTYQYWSSIVLLLLFGLYVFARVSNQKKMTKVFFSSFNFQAAKQLYREDYKTTKRFSILLWLCFLLVFTFLVHITNKYFGLIFQEYSQWQQYLLFLGIILLIYVSRFTLNAFIASIIEQSELAREYLFSVTVFSQTLGFVLFPFILCLYLTPYPTEWFLYPALVVSMVFYGLRVIRGFFISVVEQHIGILYIFLYLCTLEILPILVLIKFLFVNF